MTIKIIGGGTSRTMRAHWAASETGIAYQSELIGPRTGETQTKEFKALNAKEKIPVLIQDALVLTESAAIVAHLGRLHGTLLPTSPELLARYDEWQSFILMELDAQSLYIMRKHGDLAHIYGEAAAAMDTARAGFSKQIKLAATALQNNNHLLGNEFSGIDILLTTCLDWAVAYKISLDPVLMEYLKTIHSRPAYQAAYAHNFSISAAPN
jgi:glutathione S-transferase